MEKVTEELIREIGQNDMKAMEITKSMIRLFEENDQSVALDVLADCVLEYLEKNSQILESIL